MTPTVKPPRSLLWVSLAALSTHAYALPFTITATSLPTSYPGTASYTITKNTPVGSTGNIVKWLPPNVSIATLGTTCATAPNTPFTLSNQQSCTLNLTVSGAVDSQDPDPNHHLMICLSDRVTCAGPNPQNSIHVTAASSSVTPRFTTAGYYSIATLGEAFPLAYYSEDGGQNWNASSITGGTPNRIQGVACDNTGLQCTAVGIGTAANFSSYYTSTGGETWTRTTSAPGGFIYTVACDGPTGLMCVAMGQSTTNPSLAIGYSTVNGGQAWTAIPSLPQLLFAEANRLNGVACDNTGTTCIAVGTYSAPAVGIASNPITYYTTGNTSSWTMVIPTPVGGVATIQSLTGVACSSSGTNCTAVGYYILGAGRQPLSYRTSNGGSSWTSSLPTASSTAFLNGVACNSTGLSCIAVGNYANKPVIYTTTNGGATWSSPLTTTSSPALIMPSNTDNTGSSTLQSVRCNKTNELICTAVGQYAISSTQQQPLTYYTLDGGQTWTLSVPPSAPNNVQLSLRGVG